MTPKTPLLMNCMFRFLLCAKALLLLGCTGCGSELLHKQVSPDRQHTAYMYVWDCGATTRANTRVCILPTAAKYPGKPTAEDVVVLNGNAAGLGSIAWSSTSTLLVKTGGIPIFSKKTHWNKTVVQVVHDRPLIPEIPQRSAKELEEAIKAIKGE